ncbi:MAG: hypothetical protein JWQ23_566 [Herminiimonas sp.]|nr:hypothetical protein [Herminiimonas sp.]
MDRIHSRPSVDRLFPPGKAGVGESPTNQAGQVPKKIAAADPQECPALSPSGGAAPGLAIKLTPAKRAFFDAEFVKMEQDLLFREAISFTERKIDSLGKSGQVTWSDGADGTVHLTLKENTSEKIQASLNTAASAIKAFVTGKTGAKNLIDSKRAVMTAGVSASSAALRGAAGVIAIAGTAADGRLANAVPLPLGAPTAVVGALVSTSAWFDLTGNRNKALRSLMEHKDGAWNYFNNPDSASAADINSYLVFMNGAKLIPELSASARKAMEKAHLTVARDAITNIPGTAVGSACTIGAAAGTITGTAAAGLGTVMGGAGVVTGVIDVAEAMYELDAARNMEDASIEKQSLVRQRFDAVTEGMKSDPLLRAVHETCQTHLARTEHQAGMAGKFAVSKIFKGTFGVSTGLAIAGVGIAGVLGLAVPFLGPAIAIVAAAVATVFLIGVAAKQYHKWKDEHTSKERQRDARQLIETHSREDLEKIFETGRDKFLSIARGAYGEGGKHPGFAAAKYKNVNVATNEYLALHFMALELADMASGIGYEHNVHRRGELVCDALLRNIGMTERDLEAIFLLAQVTAPADRVEFIKKSIAPAFGIAFRVASDGHEAKAAPGVHFDACVDSFLEMGVTSTEFALGIDSSGKEIDIETLYRNVSVDFFPRVDRDTFLDAVAKIDSTKIGSIEETFQKWDLNMVRGFAAWAAQQRDKDLAEFDFMLQATEDDLIVTFPGMTAQDIIGFKDFIFCHARKLEEAKDMKPGAFPAIWLGHVKDSPALIDRFTWGRTIHDAISKLPPAEFLRRA